MYHSFFIHSSVDGHLSCFHVLVIVNCAAMNNGIYLSFSILVSSGYMPRSGIAGSHGGFIPGFSLFATPFPAFIVCRLFGEGHSDQCEVMSHSSFDLHFYNNERSSASFHVFVSHLFVFSGEMSI